MAKVLMNVKTSDIGQFKDGDILLYDATKNEFYKTTADNFYKPYEIKLDELQKKYDKIVSDLKEDNEEFKKLIKSDMKDLTVLIKNFLKTKGE